MNTLSDLKRAARFALPWVAHLAATFCYLGAAWVALREGVSAPEWLLPTLDFPWFVIGLALAGMWWLGAGLRDKGWVHLLAAALFALPRLYTLPTDLFGNAPTIALNLIIGIYLHATLWRDHAHMRFADAPPNTRNMLWLPVIVLGLLALHLWVAQLHAALRAEWLALK